MEQKPFVAPDVREDRPLRIWWIPQVPMQPFYQEVGTVREAALLLHTLAKYDLFQFVQRVKPDYSNAGGLEVKTDDGWEDWADQEGRDIREVMSEEA